jgi:hypothetical protein
MEFRSWRLQLTWHHIVCSSLPKWTEPKLRTLLGWPTSACMQRNRPRMRRVDAKFALVSEGRGYSEWKRSG